MTSAAHITPGCQFASDNASGICPEAWQAIADANVGYAPAYGDDDWTSRASDSLRDIFGAEVEVFFVFNGTAANSLALSAMCQSYHSVICTDVAHVEVDECGGPEFFSNGIKLQIAQSHAGKLLPESMAEIVHRRSDIHFPKPRIVSITQATEVGTLYSQDELAAIGKAAKELGLCVHMDGARFANAIASLQLDPGIITHEVGVDVLCFGGAKNGMPLGEAVVFFNRTLAEEFDYRCKQAGQLASKMRFLAAPWVAMLESGAWLKHAHHANAMARRLEEKLHNIAGVKVLFPVEANAVFAEMSPDWTEELQLRGWRFYEFIGKGGARFMCSWSTTPEEVDALASHIQEISRTGVT